VSDFPPVRQDLMRALLSILAEGIHDDKLEDAQKLLEAVKILNPQLGCIDEFTAYIEIKKGSVLEALQIFQNAPADTSKWHAMMGLCLKRIGDPTWHWHASQALEKNDTTADYSKDLARTLLGIEGEPEQPGTKPTSGSETVNAVDSSPYINYLSV
jgi:hypothetical protein